MRWKNCSWIWKNMSQHAKSIGFHGCNCCQLINNTKSGHKASDPNHTSHAIAQLRSCNTQVCCIPTYLWSQEILASQLGPCCESTFQNQKDRHRPLSSHTSLSSHPSRIPSQSSQSSQISQSSEPSSTNRCPSCGKTAATNRPSCVLWRRGQRAPRLHGGSAADPTDPWDPTTADPVGRLFL